MEHKFDVVLANGRVYSVAHGLSFEVPDRTNLVKDIDTTAWAISDVKGADPQLDVAIVALAPKSHSKAYERAVKTFGDLRAEFLTDQRVIDEWARKAAARFASNALLVE